MKIQVKHEVVELLCGIRPILTDAIEDYQDRPWLVLRETQRLLELETILEKLKEPNAQLDA